MLKKIAALLAFVSLSVTGFVSISSTASAAGGTDATLSGFEIHGNVAVTNDHFWDQTTMWGLQPGQYFYDAFAAQSSVKLFTKTTDPDATVTVTGAGLTNAAPAAVVDTGWTGWKNTVLNLGTQIDQVITVTVTAGDGVTKQDYKLNINSGQLPQPQILSNTLSKVSTAGGTQGVMYIKNFTPCAYIEYSYNKKSEDDSISRVYERLSYNMVTTDENGISKVTVQAPGTTETFRNEKAIADLTVSNSTRWSRDGGCVGNSYLWGLYSQTTIPNQISFFNPEVTSTDMPATVSQFTAFKINGPGMNSNAALGVYLLNPATGNSLGLSWNRISNDSMLVWLSGWDRSDEWKTAQNLQLVVEQYDGYNGYDENWNYSDSVILYTKNVKFKPFTATAVAVSPAKGPVTGGNKVTITGHGLCNPDRNNAFATITIGGNPVTDVRNQDCTFYTSTDNENWDGVQRLTFIVPPGTAGTADIAVDSGWGPTVLSQKYIYGARPTITAVTPNKVATTGGSIITITGKDFGLSGTPVVIIDGEKSPYVVRVSSTKVLAMVPAHTAGDATLDIISSSGGGSLDVLSKITYQAATTAPVITSITPALDGLAGGSEVVIVGKNFDKTATGVTIDGVPAKITAATTTSLTIEAPAGESLGAKTVVVATPLGLTSKANGFTYKADPGITAISPNSIPSYASAAEAKVDITGNDFGTTGKLTIGSGAAINYTATNGGTKISNIDIPTTTAGTLKVTITPTGSKKSYTSTVLVTGPKITYVGPKQVDPTNLVFGDANPWTGSGWGYVPAAGNNGSDPYIIQGSGFGSTAGTLKLGTTTITTTSWTDTLITFVSPAIAAGTYDLSVKPATGTLAATQDKAVVIGSLLPTPLMKTVAANGTVRNGDPSNYFWPQTTDSDLYTLTGSGFLGTDNGASTKLQMVASGDMENPDNWITVTTTSVTDTTIVFKADRTIPVFNWIALRIVTNVTTSDWADAMYYNSVETNSSYWGWDSDRWNGLCSKTAVSGYTPAVIHITDSNAGMGTSGVVKLGGVTVTGGISWSASAITINFASSNVTTAVWGKKVLSFTPAGGLDPFEFEFNCAVDTTVTTKINNATTDYTIAAGSAFAQPTSALNNPVTGATAWSEPNDNYEYQTKANRLTQGVWGTWVKGLPYATGEYYVRARLQGATYDAVKYNTLTVSDVHVIITGTPVTLTPKLVAGGSTITYRGQLGDGTNNTPNDITYTATPAPTDAITSVTYAYRNHACTSLGWAIGLPKNVAVIPSNCGGDGTTVGTWDIKVVGFKMLVNGVDQSFKYVPTFDTFNLTINKKDVTLSTVKAEKVYDATNKVTLSDVVITGGITGETLALDPTFARGATFADANAGTNKPVTLGGPFKLAGIFNTNYQITNPNMAVTGNIKKATADVKLVASVTALVLGQTSSVNLTLTNTDVKSKRAPYADANVPAPVVISKTPGVCTISGLVVTPVSAGTCIIQGTQAVSTNYNAGISFADNDLATEFVTIKIYAAAKDLSVLADDMKVAVGDSLNPSVTVNGLLDEDSFDGVQFDYYSGSTKLDAAPTAIGTYKMVPKGGSLTAANSSAYTGVVKYIGGKLVITPVPPTISKISPAHGPEAGGDVVTIRGTGLQAATSITLGTTTLRKPAFTVNAAGTAITFVVPAGTGGLDVVVNAGTAEATSLYTYDAPFKAVVDEPKPVTPVDPTTPTEPTGPLKLKLTLKLKVGSKLSGQDVGIAGGGLMPNSDYVLEMHSDVIQVWTGKTDANGDFKDTVTLPGSVCIEVGKHSLVLSGTTPAGKPTSDEAFFSLTDGCKVGAAAAKTGDKEWTLDGFLFGYCSPVLSKGGKQSLNDLVVFIKGAKTVTIFGYTETDTKSAAIKKSNLKLATQRTESVRDYLKTKGITAKFVTIGKGGVNPVSLTDQAKNRRVVIKAQY